MHTITAVSPQQVASRIVAGKDLVTHTEVGASERAMEALLVLTPLALGRAVRLAEAAEVRAVRVSTAGVAEEMAHVGIKGRAGIAGRVGGRAPEYAGGRISESDFLNAAERYLGPRYREVSPGRYVSADGVRQVRFGAHEVRGRTLHAHFEAFDQRGGRIIESTRVELLGK